MRENKREYEELKEKLDDKRMKERNSKRETEKKKLTRVVGHNLNH